MFSILLGGTAAKYESAIKINLDIEAARKRNYRSTKDRVITLQNLSVTKFVLDSDAFFIITVILEHIGTRRDTNIINNFFPDFEKPPKDVNQWKQNAIFSIKRRSLN